MRQRPNQKLLSIVHPGLGSWLVGGHEWAGLARLSHLYRVKALVQWYTGLKVTGALSSFLKFSWGPKLSFRVQSHIQIWFLGNCSLSFLWKSIRGGWGDITSLLKVPCVLLVLVSMLCWHTILSPGTYQSMFLLCQLEFPSQDFLLESPPFCLGKKIYGWVSWG